MTKDEALKLALEVMHNQGDVGVDEWIAAKAAIKQALAQPNRGSVGVQEAQRQWVGLTEYQRAECWYGANCFEQKPPPPNDDYAITIEAKLRSKNT
jgi:hypothetical protein